MCGTTGRRDGLRDQLRKAQEFARQLEGTRSLGGTNVALEPIDPGPAGPTGLRFRVRR